MLNPEVRENPRSADQTAVLNFRDLRFCCQKSGCARKFSIFPRTSGITASYREPSNNDDIRDNIQLSRKRQRAVAGKPNNDPSWSSPHVECTTTVSQRTFYRNVKRPNRATSGNAAVRLQPVRLHPLAK